MAERNQLGGAFGAKMPAICAVTNASPLGSVAARNAPAAHGGNAPRRKRAPFSG